MKQELVTVDSFTKSIDAEALRLRLREAGIASYLANDNVVTADWFLGVAVGFIQLQVAVQDSAAALEVYKQYRADMNQRLQARSADPNKWDDDSCLDCGHAMTEAETACPNCGWTYLDDDATS